MNYTIVYKQPRMMYTDYHSRQENCIMSLHETSVVIDWKTVSKSPGYKSLKAAYIKDVLNATRQSHPMRSKEIFLTMFHKAIRLAQHHAHVNETSVENVLQEWELRRTSWWFSFYSNIRRTINHPHQYKRRNKVPDRTKKARWSKWYKEQRKYRNL